MTQFNISRHYSIKAAILGLIAAQGVQALELSLSTWISEGTTEWSHNAQKLAPEYGDPTSRLSYQDTTGPIFELAAQHEFTDTFDISGALLLGQISDGLIYDEDFLSAEYVTSQGFPTTEDYKFLETVSDVTNGEVSGFNIDAGYLVNLNNNQFRINAGYMNWSETYDATGGSIVVCRLQGCPPPGTKIIGDGILALTNEVTWNMFYIGADGSFALNDKFEVGFGFKILPFGEVENIDTHHLRDDLAKPSVRQEADGSGIQGELGLKYHINPQFSISGGYRTRSLSIDYTDNGHTVYGANGASATMDIRTLESSRSGFLLGINYSL